MKQCTLRESFSMYTFPSLQEYHEDMDRTHFYERPMNNEEAKRIEKKVHYHVSKRNYKDAIKAYDELITLEPCLTFAYFERARWLQNELREYKKAIDDYTTAIELQDKLAKEYHNDIKEQVPPDLKNCPVKAYYYAYGLRSHDFKPLSFLKILKIQPDLAAVYYYRGCVQYIVGEYEKAIDDFTKAICLNGDLDAYKARFLAYYELGEYKKAKEYYERFRNSKAYTHSD